MFGGFELLDATLTENFGVSIDGNFKVDFTGFEAIIDMVGGIDIELTSAEADYINKRKQRFTRGYKRYKEISGLIEWKECQIFHSIFT